MARTVPPYCRRCRDQNQVGATYARIAACRQRWLLPASSRHTEPGPVAAILPLRLVPCICGRRATFTQGTPGIATPCAGLDSSGNAP